MRNLIFATSNKDKLAEAEVILDVKLKSTSLEIEEIQSLDIVKVAKAKALAYFEAFGQPVFVEDVSLEFSGLNGLPGTYIKDFSTALGNEGLCKLARGLKNRQALARTALVLIDNRKKVHTFIGQVKGCISRNPNGEGFGWDPIFIPQGSRKTFGQMSLAEKNKYSMRRRALGKLQRYLIGHSW